MTQPSGTAPAGAAVQQPKADTLISGEQQVLPVMEEVLEVRKVAVETGAVRIRKIVHEGNRTVGTTLMHEIVSVTRTPMDRVVDATFDSRQEGDTLIIPVFKEVVTRHLVLVEEVRVTTRRSHENSTEQVSLKREEAVVERYDAQTGSWTPDPCA